MIAKLFNQIISIIKNLRITQLHQHLLQVGQQLAPQVHYPNQSALIFSFSVAFSQFHYRNRLKFVVYVFHHQFLSPNSSAVMRYDCAISIYAIDED